MIYIVLHYYVLEFMHSDREEDAPGQNHIDGYVDLAILTKYTNELTTVIKEFYVKE